MATFPSQPQVPAEHYRPASYDEWHRWISYWYQIQSIAKCRPQNVLEIGVGTGLLRWYLRERLNVAVTTVDIDPALRPDAVADVRNLSQVFSERQFDVVCAFQVLEHLPFQDFGPALAEMSRVSKQWILISLPHNGRTLQMRWHVWRARGAVGWKIGWRRRWKFDGEHYWEVGTVGHQRRDVRRVIESEADLCEEYFYPDYPYHRAYVMRRRG